MHSRKKSRLREAPEFASRVDSRRQARDHEYSEIYSALDAAANIDIYIIYKRANFLALVLDRDREKLKAAIHS